MGKYPGANQMAEQERYNHGNMHLTTHVETSTEHEPEAELHKCPACKKRIPNTKIPQSPPSNTTAVQNAVGKRVAAKTNIRKTQLQ